MPLTNILISLIGSKEDWKHIVKVTTTPKLELKDKRGALSLADRS